MQSVIPECNAGSSCDLWPRSAVTARHPPVQIYISRGGFAKYSLRIGVIAHRQIRVVHKLDYNVSPLALFVGGVTANA